MHDPRCVLHPCHVDQPPRNQRTAKCRSEQITILVDGPGLQRGQDEIADELFARVYDVRAHRAQRERPLADVHQLAALTDVECDGNDLGAVHLLQPRDRD